MKSGFVTVLGKPNVGKSSLMNKLVGEKVAIVSPKAQTTRTREKGILTEGDCQMIFIDTPGVHKPKNKLGEYMEKCVRSSTDGTDAIVIVLDATRRLTEGDIAFVEKYLKGSEPVFLVINKIDAVGYDTVYPMLDKLGFLLTATPERAAVREIIPLSARTGRNVDLLKKYLKEVMPEGEFLYPADEITDKSERHVICEIVREKALTLLNDEIPHGIGVAVTAMNYDDYGTAHISIDVIVEKESHKSIVIGAGGEKLKMIAERARKDVEKLIGAKVYMELFVKVRENWRNDGLVMNDVGYNPKNIG